MSVPLLHRLLGLAGIYACLDSLAAALRAHAATILDGEARLRTQEQAMSKATLLLAGLAASLATLTTSQKREADDVARISNGIAQLVAGKSVEGDGSVTMTADELAQLQGFADGLKTVADNSQANVDALDRVVAEIPTDAPTEPTGDPEPSAPGDPVAAEPVKADPTNGIDPSVSSTIPDGMSQNG